MLCEDLLYNSCKYIVIILIGILFRQITMVPKLKGHIKFYELCDLTKNYIVPNNYLCSV